MYTKRNAIYLNIATVFLLQIVDNYAVCIVGFNNATEKIPMHLQHTNYWQCVGICKIIGGTEQFNDADEICECILDENRNDTNPIRDEVLIPITNQKNPWKRQVENNNSTIPINQRPSKSKHTLREKIPQNDILEQLKKHLERLSKTTNSLDRRAEITGMRSLLKQITTVNEQKRTDKGRILSKDNREDKQRSSTESTLLNN